MLINILFLLGAILQKWHLLEYYSAINYNLPKLQVLKGRGYTNRCLPVLLRMREI